MKLLNIQRIATSELGRSKKVTVSYSYDGNDLGESEASCLLTDTNWHTFSGVFSPSTGFFTFKRESAYVKVFFNEVLSADLDNDEFFDRLEQRIETVKLAFNDKYCDDEILTKSRNYMVK